MKNFRRKMKKRTRAVNLNELEDAFYGLVQKHNDLVKAHSILRQRLDQHVATVKRQFSATEDRVYF